MIVWANLLLKVHYCLLLILQVGQDIWEYLHEALWQQDQERFPRPKAPNFYTLDDLFYYWPSQGEGEMSHLVIEQAECFSRVNHDERDRFMGLLNCHREYSVHREESARCSLGAVVCIGHGEKPLREIWNVNSRWSKPLIVVSLKNSSLYWC